MIASSLFALVLSAEAANVPKIKNIRVRQVQNEGGSVSYLDASADDANAEIASLTAGLSQDGTVSALTLSPTNTGLAGESPIVLPTRSATLTLTTLDANNLPLRSFRGWIEPDGSAGLEAELLCEEGGEPCIPVAAPDLEVLAIHAIDGTLALELVGSDTYDVALATLTITETTRGGEVCVQYDEFENCLEWTVTSVQTSTDYDIHFDTVTTVWSAALSSVGEVNDVLLKAWDENGTRLDTAKTRLGQPWETDTVGVNVLVSDEDPLTSVGFFVAEDETILSVVSEGWTAATAPRSAEVAWQAGETWIVPATAYQVGTAVFLGEGDFAEEQFELWVDGVAVQNATKVPQRGVCLDNTCISLKEEEDGWWLQVTAYASTVAELPEALTVELAPVYGLVELSQSSFDLVFEDEVAVVFGHSFSWGVVPVGLDLQAQVKLLGAPKRNGRAPTLAKGTVFGQVAWGAGGHLVLSGRDKDVVVARGDILIGGEPVDIELPNPETGEPMVGVPPVVVLHATSNGKGTRNTASNTGQTQSTDLL